MIRSMTGFGAGRATVDGEEIAVEVRSLNHKFCEVKARLPREISSLEPNVIKAAKSRLFRGAIEIAIKRQPMEPTTSGVPVVDLRLAIEYRRALASIARQLALPDEVSVHEIALQPGIIRLQEPQVNLETSSRALEAALTAAIDALIVMREKEGAALQLELESRLKLVQQAAEEVRALAPKAVEEYHQRLSERVAELSRAPVDPQRLAQEVAFLAERTDVAEEMTRLTSHVEQFRALMVAREPAGRKMDFIVQEMHREVNTTGAKSQHAEISSRILTLKAELERIREQVQNVE
jgi:uncharacterized protein (TIGR00255 family)